MKLLGYYLGSLLLGYLLFVVCGIVLAFGFYLFRDMMVMDDVFRTIIILTIGGLYSMFLTIFTNLFIFILADNPDAYLLGFYLPAFLYAVIFVGIYFANGEHENYEVLMGIIPQIISCFILKKRYVKELKY